MKPESIIKKSVCRLNQSESVILLKILLAQFYQFACHRFPTICWIYKYFVAQKRYQHIVDRIIFIYQKVHKRQTKDMQMIDWVASTSWLLPNIFLRKSGFWGIHYIILVMAEHMRHMIWPWNFIQRLLETKCKYFTIKFASSAFHMNSLCLNL